MDARPVETVMAGLRGCSPIPICEFFDALIDRIVLGRLNGSLSPIVCCWVSCQATVPSAFRRRPVRLISSPSIGQIKAGVAGQCPFAASTSTRFGPWALTRGGSAHVIAIMSASRESKDLTQIKKDDAADCADGTVYTVLATRLISSRFIPKLRSKPSFRPEALR